MRRLVNQTAQLVGFLAAHAMLQVAKGATLGPLIIFEQGDGTTHIIRIHEASGEKCQQRGCRT